MLLGRATFFSHLLIAFVALWQGLDLVPTLVNGYVLIALPAVIARVLAVICLGCAACLGLLALREGDRPEIPQRPTQTQSARVSRASAPDRWPWAVLVVAVIAAWRAARRVSTRTSSNGIPLALLREARPIGRGPRFQPAVRGPIIGRCRRPLGARYAVHVEVFAANRVVIIPAGIGTRPPRTRLDARITAAGCYGDLVTLDPTGVVLVRTQRHLTLADLFRAWGEAAHERRGWRPSRPLPATASPSFIDGRRWQGPPGRVPLTPRAEIVLEVGPHVPPHTTFTFPPEP